jgi:polyphosphate kinase
MTGASEAVKMTKLTIAPTALREKFYQLIEREIQASTTDRPGLIMAKVNSLQDKGICQALYRASIAGVKIKLNVRGICCLRPGVKGISDNIEVVSIVDRFLEHARIFYFRNAGNEELYLASADWMGRNLNKRIESFFPVTSRKLQKRLIHALEVYFNDDSNSFVLCSDGSYRPRKSSKKGSCRAQEILYNEAVKAVESAVRTPKRFRPISNPKN